MTNEDIDKMWGQALNESIKNGEDFTRYRFAALVASAEREEIAKLADSMNTFGLPPDVGAAIRARGNK